LPQSTETPLGRLLECLDVEAELTGFSGGQAAQAFTKQHCGALLIAPLKVVVGHGNLENALEDRP